MRHVCELTRTVYSAEGGGLLLQADMYRCRIDGTSIYISTTQVSTGTSHAIAAAALVQVQGGQVQPRGCCCGCCAPCTLQHKKMLSMPSPACRPTSPSTRPRAPSCPPSWPMSRRRTAAMTPARRRRRRRRQLWRRSTRWGGWVGGWGGCVIFVTMQLQMPMGSQLLTQ
jgi:hypothetical protein